MSRVVELSVSALFFPGLTLGQALNCNLDHYKPLEGLSASIRGGVLEAKWRGERDQELRAEFSINGSFANHQFRIPFRAAGKKWVRFAAWDSAGNGAFTQPVHLGFSGRTFPAMTMDARL